MRPLPAPALLLTVALCRCAPDAAKPGAWGSTPGVGTADESISAAEEPSSNTTHDDDATSTTHALTSPSTGTEGTSEVTVWDMGVPDFGGVQPTGCRGKIDFLFAISAGGNMQVHQDQLIAGSPGFMDAIAAQLPDFDVHTLPPG